MQELSQKQHGDNTNIIYILSHDSHSANLFQIGDPGLIKKPIDEKELDDVFCKALKQVKKHGLSPMNPIVFNFKTGNDVNCVKADEIVYLKNSKRIIELYVWDRTESAIALANKFYSTVGDALARLPARQFIRCERSHIVNMDFVQLMVKNTFALVDKNETRIPIGRTFKTEVRIAYTMHLGLRRSY